MTRQHRGRRSLAKLAGKALDVAFYDQDRKELVWVMERALLNPHISQSTLQDIVIFLGVERGEVLSDTYGRGSFQTSRFDEKL